MAQPSVWFFKSDMLVEVSNLRSSTMATGDYLNNSGGVTAQIWQSQSTEDLDDYVTGGTLSYVTGSNGQYRLTIQSTEHNMALRTVGMAIVTVAHGGLNREWRPTFRVDHGRY